MDLWVIWTASCCWAFWACGPLVHYSLASECPPAQCQAETNRETNGHSWTEEERDKHMLPATANQSRRRAFSSSELYESLLSLSCRSSGSWGCPGWLTWVINQTGTCLRVTGEVLIIMPGQTTYISWHSPWETGVCHHLASGGYFFMASPKMN